MQKTITLILPEAVWAEVRLNAIHNATDITTIDEAAVISAIILNYYITRRKD